VSGGLAVMLRACVSMLVAISLSFPAIAHHSSAIYDKEKEIVFEGTVSRFEWSNPHIFIHVEGEADGTASRVWQFETSNPSMMRSRGWDRNMLEKGDLIKIGGNPGRNKSKGIALLTLLEKDGVDLLNEDNFFGSSLVSEAKVDKLAESLEGHWVVVPDRELYEILRPWNLQLTEKGQRSVDEYDESTMLPQLQCIPSVAPSYMFIPDLKVVEYGEDSIRFLSEYQGVERVFHLNQESHAGAEPTLHGHAIAHWEGDTLVVDTSRFSRNRSGHQNGLASGPEKHLLEWYTLNSDGKSMTWRFRLEDPEYFSNVVEGEAQYLFSPERKYSPDPCSIENARRLL